MKIKTLLLSALTIGFLTACEDLFEDNTLEPDGSLPSLTIHTPFNNQSINASKGLRLDMTMVDKDIVQEFEVAIKGDRGESNFISFTKFPAKSVVEFDSTLSFIGATPGNYTLYIKATDKRTNVGLQTIKFTVN